MCSETEHMYMAVMTSLTETDYHYYVASRLTVISVAVSKRPEGPFEFYGYKYFSFQSPVRIAVTFRGNGSGFMEMRTQPEAEPIAKIPLSTTETWKDFSEDMLT